MVSVAISRQVVPACRFSVARLHIRIIIKLKARSAFVLLLALRCVYHSSFGVCTHLLELFVKSLVLNRGFAGVRFSVRNRLGRAGTLFSCNADYVNSGRPSCTDFYLQAITMRWLRHQLGALKLYSSGLPSRVSGFLPLGWHALLYLLSSRHPTHRRLQSLEPSREYS